MADLSRIFVGMAPPPEVRMALVDALEPLRPLPGRAIPAENWHLTMRFIGPMEQVTYERMLAELDATQLGGSFSIRFEGLGAFPNPRRATVLWVGISHGGDELVRLAAAVEDAVASAGVDPEERPFRPHLTVARIRPPVNVTDLVDQASLPAIRWRADRLTVFRSHLGSGGARYEPLDTIDL